MWNHLNGSTLGSGTLKGATKGVRHVGHTGCTLVAHCTRTGVAAATRSTRQAQQSRGRERKRERERHQEKSKNSIIGNILKNININNTHTYTPSQANAQRAQTGLRKASRGESRRGEVQVGHDRADAGVSGVGGRWLRRRGRPTTPTRREELPVRFTHGNSWGHCGT